MGNYFPELSSDRITKAKPNRNVTVHKHHFGQIIVHVNKKDTKTASIDVVLVFNF